MAIEIVDFHIKNGDFPWFFVCLPEGKVLFTGAGASSLTQRLLRHRALRRRVRAFYALRAQRRPTAW